MWGFSRYHSIIEFYFNFIMDREHTSHDFTSFILFAFITFVVYFNEHSRYTCKTHVFCCWEGCINAKLIIRQLK